MTRDVRRSRVVATLAAVALALVVPWSAWAQGGVTLTIWKVGSPHRATVPPANVPPELERDARRQGVGLRVESLPAEGFAARFFDAVKRGAAPDVVAFDNIGILNGISTPLGTFAGIGQDPAVRRDLVEVKGAFDEILLPGRGWAFLVKPSPRHAAAALLAMRPPVCSGQRVAPRGADGIAAIAGMVARAHVSGDFSGVQHYVDPERVRGVGQGPPVTRVDAVSSCGVLGNERLAFTLQKVSFDAGSTIGHASVLLVFRRPGSAWQLLAASRDPVSTNIFANQLPVMTRRLDLEPATRLPDPPSLRSPADGAFPAAAAGQRFGDFTFAPSDSRGVIAHVAEFAYNDDVRFVLLPGAQGAQGRVSAGELWHVGGPWTWRIWAITRSGDVVFSETRTFTH